MTPAELVKRLRDRAATSRANAQTYEASGYRGEAFAALERAAFDLAADDAERVEVRVDIVVRDAMSDEERAARISDLKELLKPRGGDAA